MSTWVHVCWHLELSADPTLARIWKEAFMLSTAHVHTPLSCTTLFPPGNGDRKTRMVCENKTLMVFKLFEFRDKGRQNYIQ
jgi:hypothetical protein